MSKQYLVVFRLQRWDSLETNVGLPVAVEALPGCVGFLPVFARRDDAEREYPASAVVEIEEVEEAQR